MSLLDHPEAQVLLTKRRPFPPIPFATALIATGLDRGRAGLARTMTWEGKHPEVVLVETPYSKGVRVGPKEMEELESQVVRLPSLEKWFVAIPSGSAVDSG